MKVLHVIDNLRLGGTQNLAWRCWKGLANQGIDVSLCVLTNLSGERDWEWLPENVSRLAVHGDYRRPGAIGSWSKRVAEVAREQRADLLHSWLWTSDVVAAGAASQGRLPHLVHVVDRRIWQESNQLKHRYRKWLTKRLFRKAQSRFLAVSQAAADYAMTHLTIPTDRMGVAYNSISTKPFLQIEDSPSWSNENAPLRLGIAARIEPEKGHLFLFKAIKLLKERGIEVNLQVTGDGSDREMLEKYVKDHQLSDQIRFIGWVDNVTEFLSGIDVFMVPSIDSEGLPTTILEAMAAGRMVIATDIGGASEAITAQTGRIIPAKQVDPLVDAIADVYSSREQAAATTAAARRRVELNFSMPQMLRTITKQYERMATGR